MVVKFPSWRYHKTEPAKVVDEVEAQLLGPGWFDNQAEADAYVAAVDEDELEDNGEAKKKAKKGR
jgi:hypothetical protein